MEIVEEELAYIIRSFANGLAGGHDGLRPQHLKNMINSSAGGCTAQLLSTLASFVNLVLAGKTPISVRPFFFGASLVALKKKSGGIRPIAVESTLRRLVAKCAGIRIKADMEALLAPRQLGYEVAGGAEAAVHAARLYLECLADDEAVVKLDFKNAFNSVRRDKMLESIRDLAPDLFPFVHSVYSYPSPTTLLCHS